MFLSFTAWILGGLCCALAVLYARAHRSLQSGLSHTQDLQNQLSQLSADLTKAETRIHEIQSRRSELISAVTHEIRTPLTCLMGYTQMLLESEFPRERQVAYLSIVLRETQRLNSLLADFLDVQLLESTKTVALRPGRLEDLLRESFELFRSQPGPHRFVLDIDEPLPAVNLDARRVRQVLWNLMSNAVKYSPGGGTIRLNAFVRGQQVVACIQDQGIGIPAEAIPRLFTKFFRVKQEENGDIPGTGLGLALVRECVRAQGGEVWVESNRGQGSAFYFTLPVITHGGRANGASSTGGYTESAPGRRALI